MILTERIKNPNWLIETDVDKELEYKK